jgi:hypothetical protein
VLKVAKAMLLPFFTKASFSSIDIEFELSSEFDFGFSPQDERIEKAKSPGNRILYFMMI